MDHPCNSDNEACWSLLVWVALLCDSQMNPSFAGKITVCFIFKVNNALTSRKCPLQSPSFVLVGCHDVQITLPPWADLLLLSLSLYHFLCLCTHIHTPTPASWRVGPLHECWSPDSLHSFPSFRNHYTYCVLDRGTRYRGKRYKDNASPQKAPVGVGSGT